MYRIPSQHFAHIICMQNAWKSLIRTSKVKWSSKPFGVVSNHLSAISGCHLKKLDQLLIATRFLLLWRKLSAGCNHPTWIMLEAKHWRQNLSNCFDPSTLCWGNYSRIYQNTFYKSSNLTYLVPSHQAQLSQFFYPRLSMAAICFSVQESIWMDLTKERCTLNTPWYVNSTWERGWSSHTE